MHLQIIYQKIIKIFKFIYHFKDSNIILIKYKQIVNLYLIKSYYYNFSNLISTF